MLPEGVCNPSSTPLGALPPAKPAWCSSLIDAPGTAIQGSNSWLDTFDGSVIMAKLGEHYRAFNRPPETGSDGCKALHFRHNNHWMTDMIAACEGVMMRPSKTFRFRNGKLIIEVDVAAGISDYGDGLWPEIDITTAPAPSGKRRDGLYAYDSFPGHWTFGCRLEADRTPTCALFDNSERGSTNEGRVFELSFFQHEGAQYVYGGEPSGARADAWRICQGTDPDLNCRDRFRFEISKDTVKIFVNGVRYMEHRGLPADKQLPPEFLNSRIFVYFSGWGQPETAEVSRFHWDRIAINP